MTSQYTNHIYPIQGTGGGDVKCPHFGCGKTLTLLEQLCGWCFEHQTKPPCVGIKPAATVKAYKK